MFSTESDTSQDTAESHKIAVREYLLAHGEVASKDELRAGTDVPAWYITQIASQDMFYTSLNQNSEYVASKHVVGRRSTHDGFWRPEVDDGVAVFHRKETTKATLKHLAFTRPSGLTAPEARTESIEKRARTGVAMATLPIAEDQMQRAYEEFENGEFETSLQRFQNTATVLEGVHTIAADVGLEELRSEAEAYMESCENNADEIRDVLAENKKPE